jgi:hypothetical protein
LALSRRAALTLVARLGRRLSGTLLGSGGPSLLRLEALAALLMLSWRECGSPMMRNSPEVIDQPWQRGQKSHLIS